MLYNYIYTTLNKMSLSYRVYKNLSALLSCRKLELVSADLTKISSKKIKDGELLDEEEFTSAIQYHGFIMIEAKDTPTKDRRHPKGMHESAKKMPTNTILVLLDQYSNFTAAAQNFVKLLNRIPGINDTSRDHNMDIIIIPYKEPGSNITNKLAEYADNGTDKGGYVRFNIFRYAYFTSNKMNSILVSKSQILPRELEEEALKKMHTTQSAHGKIRVIDVVSVWLGAEIGDMIQEDIYSESSGIERNYRFVRP
jgi:DNA-directed RNA polymerase subunit H (RpoH/RPB5)